MSEGLISASVGVLLLGIFTLSARHKLRDLPRFAADLQAYRLLPVPLVKPVAWLLAVVELALLVTIPIWFAIGIAGGALLLFIYLFAMATNLIRGHVLIDCGCGDVPSRLSWWLVLRNACLIGAALVALSQGAPTTVGAWGLGIALGGVGLVLYGGFEQMLANHSFRIRTWGVS